MFIHGHAAAVLTHGGRAAGAAGKGRSGCVAGRLRRLGGMMSGVILRGLSARCRHGRGKQDSRKRQGCVLGHSVLHSCKLAYPLDTHTH